MANLLIGAVSVSSIIFIFFLFLTSISLVTGRGPHVIKFRSLNLYPEGIAYDPSAQHFLVGSVHHRTIHSVSDAGVAEIFISDPSLPENSTFLGLAVDSLHNRLLAVVHSIHPLPTFNALAAYDLRSRNRLFLAPLLPPSEDGSRPPVANDVAVDFKGNAYVTNSLGYPEGNFIWKVNADGESSVFSRSPVFNHHPVNCDPPESHFGLNGIAYVSKGYFLVGQTNTGKLFKVDAEDGTARTVLLTEDLPLADGIAVRKRDGVVVVVSYNKAWFLKSDDSWGQGVVYDKIDLDSERFPTTAAVGRDERVYVLYGNIKEGVSSNGEGGREWFAIEEVRSEKDSEEENLWLYVMLGLGLAYFLFWRFQMKQLVQNMDKKTH